MCRSLVFKVLYIFLFCSLLSCGNSQTDSDDQTDSTTVIIDTLQNEEKKIFVEYIFEKPSTDTVRFRKEVRLDNMPYLLEICLFSKNDSLVINEVKQNDSLITHMVYHNKTASILLTHAGNTQFEKRISKDLFRDSLAAAFESSARMHKIEYDSSAANKLYFHTRLGVPDTDFMLLLGFSIIYKGNEKGRLDYWYVEEGKSNEQ